MKWKFLLFGVTANAEPVRVDEIPEPLPLPMPREEVERERRQRELIERLAEKEHGSWSHWMKYLFSKCTANADGSMTIPPALVARW
jgi:hypothetical protein